MTWAEAQARKKQRAEEQQRREELKELARGPMDLPFLLLVVLLTGIGLVMLFSASFPRAYYKGLNPAHYLIRQGVFAVIGFCAMMAAGKINYRRFRAFAKLGLLIAIVLLILVLVPGVGLTRNNATRWLGVGELLTFQPSEVAKFAVVLYFADSISKKKDQMRTIRQGILPYVLILGIIAALMMKEPHLSGTVLILGVGAIMMFVGGLRWGWVVAGVIAVGAVAYLMFTGVITYGQDRISMWLDPWIDAQDEGYQMVQSLIGIGSGGLLGTGLGKSRQKFLYLPEEHNDFIFAIVCEELGLIGAGLILILFAALIIRGYWIAINARDRFGSLLVVGCTSLLAMQVFLNVAVVTGLVPATGISLPFFSYGGTALLFQLGEMGVILSVSRQMKPPKNG